MRTPGWQAEAEIPHLGAGAHGGAREAMAGEHSTRMVPADDADPDPTTRMHRPSPQF